MAKKKYYDCIEVEVMSTLIWDCPICETINEQLQPYEFDCYDILVCDECKSRFEYDENEAWDCKHILLPPQ